MSSELRWTIFVAVLAVAGVVALWPRDGGSQLTAGGSAPQVLTDLVGTASAPDDAALADMRRRADLQACPTGQPGTAATGAPLTGIVVPCLGEPSSIDLGAALSGRAALINIWASWCQSCRDELPVLNAYAGQPGIGRYTVAAIGVTHDTPDSVLTARSVGIARSKPTSQSAAACGGWGIWGSTVKRCRKTGQAGRRIADQVSSGAGGSSAMALTAFPRRSARRRLSRSS
jgi:thiol-disulfide isomerase/thioredoxin